MKQSEATRAKRSAALKGIKRSPETRAKIAAAKLGEKNPAWKGDDAGYWAIHYWMYRHHPKSGTCEDCGMSGKTDYASIDHSYVRDRSKWRELCRKCHKRLDKAGN